MKPFLKFLCLLEIWSIFTLCGLGNGIYEENPFIQQPDWPDHYSASFGFTIMADHNGLIIVSSVDSTSQAWTSGVRPGMEILGWNTLPIRRKLESMKVRKYRDFFPAMTEQNIRLALLTRGRPGESAEVFFMTPTGNNWGIRVKADRRKKTEDRRQKTEDRRRKTEDGRQKTKDKRR